MPEIQHQLEIIPNVGNTPNEIQLLEIKAAYGNVVPLSNFKSINGWTLRDGLLIADGPAAQPIRYSFYGPINQQVRVTFEASPNSGIVEVVLDGRRQDLDLKSLDGNQKRVRMDTQYQWGFLNFLIIPIVVANDLFTIILILALIWMVQEINQNRAVKPGQGGSESFLSHRNGLLILCGLALILHTINFLAVPLAVLKDSPSYLQGAVYWIRYHSLDGVSSYQRSWNHFSFYTFHGAFWEKSMGLEDSIALACHCLCAC